MLRRTLLTLLLALAAAGPVRPLLAQEGSAPESGAAASAGSPANEGAPIEGFVIPPGQESLLSDMLGIGQALPAGCKFNTGAVERTLVRATYDCQGATVVVDLQHPGVAPAGAISTKRFALSVSSGSAPPGLVDAVLERIRAREGEFEWKALGADTPSPRHRLAPIAVAVAVLAALLTWLRRRSAAKRTPPAGTP